MSVSEQREYMRSLVVPMTRFFDELNQTNYCERHQNLFNEMDDATVIYSFNKFFKDCYARSVAQHKI